MPPATKVIRPEAAAPRVMLWPVTKRYASPRRFVGWLITLFRRPILRLVFPVLDDIARQADDALQQAYAELHQLKEWTRWAEETLDAGASAREVFDLRLEEHSRRLAQRLDEQRLQLDATALSISHRLDGVGDRTREIDGHLDSVAQRLDGSNRALAELTSRQGTLADRLDEVHESASKTDRHLDSISQRLDRAHAALAELTSRQGTVEDRLDEVHESASSTGRHLDSISQRLSGAHAALADLTSRQGAFEDRLDPALMALEGKTSLLEQRIDALAADQASTLASTEDSERRQIERLVRVEATLSTAQSLLTSNLNDFERHLNALTSDVAEIKATGTKLEPAVTVLAEDVARSGTAIEALQQARDRQASGLGEFERRLSALQSDVEDVKSRETGLEPAITALAEDLTRTTTQVGELQHARQRQRGEIDELAETAGALERKVAVFEALRRTLQDGLAELDKEQRRQQLLVDEAATRVGTLEDRIEPVVDSFRGRLDQVLAQIEVVEAQRRELIDEVGGVRIDLTKKMQSAFGAADRMLRKELASLAEQVAEVSRTSSQHELLDAITKNEARVESLEEESKATLAALRRRLEGLPDRPASFSELADLSERFDRFRAEAFAQVADLAQSFAEQARHDRAQVTHIDTEQRRHR